MNEEGKRWHTQIRDIPPDVWSRVLVGAKSRYIQTNGRSRPLNVGEYLTRVILLSEVVREAAEGSDTEKEFTEKVIGALEELGLEAVHA